jgi:ribonucleoside-diphosphate reductase alpha chain
LSSFAEGGGSALPELHASNEPTAPAGSPYADPAQLYDRKPPAQGIAPDLTARSGMDASRDLSSFAAGGGPTSPLETPDRGIYHAADAMKGMYDMGDAPSCSTCGAIMVRNGACHRCMECGSTSGCS